MKRLLGLIGIIFIVNLSHSQVSSLSDLATGKMLIFTPIFDIDNDVYGYFSLFSTDRVSGTENKYEYVILDKNLNEVANGEFVDQVYKKVYSRFINLDKISNKLMLTKRYYTSNNKVSFTTSRFIGLDDNQVSDEFYFNDGAIVEGIRDPENIIKEEKKVEFTKVPLGVGNGFLIVEVEKTNSRGKPSLIEYFDVDKQHQWSYDFGITDKSHDYSLASYETDYMYFNYYTHGRKSSTAIRCLDVETGSLQFDYLLETSDSNYSHAYSIKRLGDKTVIVGKISPYALTGYNFRYSLGLFKIVLDSKGEELSKTYFLWEQASDFIAVSKKGEVEKGYKLLTQSYFVFSDGRVSVLNEKLKVGYNFFIGDVVKTTDFVLLDFDKDFNLINVTTIPKDLTKFSVSDYLFSQYLNDESGAVFFYQDFKKDDETKEKNWVLGIVSLVDGKVNHEKIPMSSDEHFIAPYIAKEGYILLREFNKNSDFDEIRLERLNLD